MIDCIEYCELERSARGIFIGVVRGTQSPDTWKEIRAWSDFLSFDSFGELQKDPMAVMAMFLNLTTSIHLEFFRSPESGTYQIRSIASSLCLQEEDILRLYQIGVVENVLESQLPFAFPDFSLRKQESVAFRFVCGYALSFFSKKQAQQLRGLATRAFQQGGVKAAIQRLSVTFSEQTFHHRASSFIQAFDHPRTGVADVYRYRYFLSFLVHVLLESLQKK